MRLQPMEYRKLVRGYERRQKLQDTNRAFWVANIMNTQLAEAIEPKKFIDILYPPTAPTNGEPRLILSENLESRG